MNSFRGISASTGVLDIEPAGAGAGLSSGSAEGTNSSSRFSSGNSVVETSSSTVLTSLSAAATSLANVGPGLGSTIGPESTFYSLSNSAKWILIISMLLGRLELFTILVLFLPAFWRK